MHVVTLKKWGNSTGVVIPAAEMKVVDAHIGERFNIIACADGSLMLKPVIDTHAGWKEAFNAAAYLGAEQMLLDEAGTDFDREEWAW